MLTVEVRYVQNLAHEEEHKLRKLVVLFVNLRFYDPASYFRIKQVARLNLESISLSYSRLEITYH